MFSAIRSWVSDLYLGDNALARHQNEYQQLHASGQEDTQGRAIADEYDGSGADYTSMRRRKPSVLAAPDKKELDSAAGGVQVRANYGAESEAFARADKALLLSRKGDEQASQAWRNMCHFCHGAGLESRIVINRTLLNSAQTYIEELLATEDWKSLLAVCFLLPDGVYADGRVELVQGGGISTINSDGDEIGPGIGINSELNRFLIVPTGLEPKFGEGFDLRTVR
jgi:hypothetical protein